MSDQLAEQATPFNQEPVTPAIDQIAPVTPTAPVAPQPTVFQIPEVAQGLVGQGKKYATPEDALAAIPHAQSHISKLEEEMASLREDLARRKSAEEILEAINKRTPEEVTAPQFDPSQLDALIENKLTAKEQDIIAKGNVSKVVNTFVEQYGNTEKAQEAYVQKAAELGLSLEYINNLAKVSPDAVFKLCGLNATRSTPSRITSNVNSEALINQVSAPQALRSVMGGSTAKDDIAAWKAAAPKTE